MWKNDKWITCHNFCYVLALLLAKTPQDINFHGHAQTMKDNIVYIKQLSSVALFGN